MTRILPNLILTVAIAVTCLAALVVFNRAAAPQAKLLPLTAAEFPDYRRIIAAVNPESLREDLSQLCAGPSRFTATPGCDAAAEFVADELRAAGYTVHYETLDADDGRTYEEKLQSAMQTAGTDA